jgi:phosphoserine phosphatase
LAEAGGRFLAGPPLSHPFGRDKLALAAALCRERDIALGDCAAYGDSIYDLALLRRVGRPVAVAPDARLRKAALTRGWEIIEESPRGSTAARRDSADAAQDYARSPLR